jgi:hypothetical protein
MKKILCIGVGLITEHFIRSNTENYDISVIVKDPKHYQKICNESVYGEHELGILVKNVDIIMNSVIDPEYVIEHSYDYRIINFCKEYNVSPVHILLGSRKQKSHLGQYSQYKNELEKLYGQHYCIILRLSNVYGDCRKFLEKRLFVPQVINSSIQGRLVFDISLNSEKYFVHAQDVCSAIKLLLKFQKYNVVFEVGGEKIIIKDIVDLISEKNRSVSIELINDRMDSFTVNDDVLRSLGWIPHKKFKEEFRLLLDKYLDSI